MDALRQRMAADEAGSGEYRRPDGTDATTYFCRIPHSPGWVFAIDLPTAEVNQITNWLTLMLTILLVTGVLVTTAVSILLGRRMVGTLRTAAAGFRRLAEGEADLTVQLAVKRSDEIGELVRDFNAFIAKLRQIVGALKSAQEEMARIGNGLDASVGDTRAAVADMSENIGRVREDSRRQSQSVSESSTAVEQIAKNIESLDHLINDQAASIVEASASIEQMVGNIKAIGDSTDRMADKFDTLSKAAAEGRDLQDLATQKISRIAEGSQSLHEANTVIANIASQTNLLAMNAAIEAAHAGEAGRGFSVEAVEIRKLAETAANQSRTISNELTRVQAAINEVVGSSRTSSEAFGRLAAHIRETDGLVRSVRQAMAEQQEGSTQILLALKSMNDVTSQVRQGSGEMRSGNQTILKEVELLKGSTREITQAMERLVETTGHITSGSERVGEIACDTTGTIRRMEEVIGRFKV
jgi:methyl-accepting chemotaxis protein